MEARKYEVLIIGGGPAGTTAASRLASLDRDVLLVEKRERIGYPVRCAEAIGPARDITRCIDIDDSYVSTVVDGLIIVSPDGYVFEAEAEKIGYIVDREKFDNHLANKAKENGAEVRTGHQAMSLIKENGNIVGAEIKDLRTGNIYSVNSAVTIGADGVESLSPRWAGIKEAYSPADVLSCAQETIEGIDLSGTMMEFHLGREFSPGGYAWVFPKGDDIANVGVGINAVERNGLNAVQYLERFLKKRCPGGKRTRTVVGGSVVARPLETHAAGGYLVIGEAGSQNNPFTGGGILTAIEGAGIAAEVVDEALRKGDTSADFLRIYDERWHEAEGRNNMLFYKAAQVFYHLEDGQMDRILKNLSREKGLIGRAGVDPKILVRVLWRSSPALLLRSAIRLWRN